MGTDQRRILTTHVGSLPRPPALLARLQARADGEPVDPPTLLAELEEAVQAGIDVVSDGEFSKPSYATYVGERLMAGVDEERNPQYAARD